MENAHKNFLNGDLNTIYPDGGTFIFERSEQIQRALDKIKDRKCPTIPQARMRRYMYYHTNIDRGRGTISKRCKSILTELESELTEVDLQYNLDKIKLYLIQFS